jgi:hypothetical protein
MSKHTFKFTCPNCSAVLELDDIALELPPFYKTLCIFCYYPLILYPRENRAEFSIEERKKTAFLVHSSKSEEKTLLGWFRALMNLYGTATRVIEEDHRSVDWLQKSLDGIKSADFVLAFLTKRYQFMDEAGKIQGWKAPDKCYEEIAISFALNKDIYALVENEVDSGNVLKTRAWCYQFKKKSSPTTTPIEAEVEFFRVFSNYVRGIG